MGRFEARHSGVGRTFHAQYSGDCVLSALAPNLTQSDARITWLASNGRLSAQVFVDNLETVVTIGRVTTRNAQAAGAYDDPRTFGVRLGYHF